MRKRLPAIGMTTLRGAALFLAAFTVIGLVGEVRGRTAGMSLWWIDIHDLPTPLRFALLAFVAALLGTWAVRPDAKRRRRWATAAAVALAAILALRDILTFYAALGAGDVHPFMPVPLSLVGAAVLGAVAASQAYHLPRLQPAFAVTGIYVLTVPAADGGFIGSMPLLIAREVAAFWSYDLRVCFGW